MSTFTDLCVAHKVPGAVFGVMRGGEVSLEAHGVTSTALGIEVTDDTVFQWGSITKVWTATLVMQMVADGELELDVPIQKWLPEFRVLDDDVAQNVTLRHLLTHTSGIGGDHIIDTGRGEDNLERYVETCAELGQDVPFGSAMSYSNSGFSIIGRVIEVVTGKSWDRVLKRRLIRPLGLTTTGTLPEEALLHRAAVGHLALPGHEPFPAPVWQLSRSAGPAGLLHGSAADLLAFAKLHMDRGREGVIDGASVAAMQERQVEVPDKWTLSGGWGLGWMLFDGNAPGYGHSGATLGQYAFLRVVPEQDLAIVLLTNAASGGLVWQALLTDLVGLEPLPEVPTEPVDVDLSLYAGNYERLNMTFDITAGDGALTARMEAHGPLAMAQPPEARVIELQLHPVDNALFMASGPGIQRPLPFVFFDFDGDRPRRFHYGGRANSRRD